MTDWIKWYTVMFMFITFLVAYLRDGQEINEPETKHSLRSYVTVSVVLIPIYGRVLGFW